MILLVLVIGLIGINNNNVEILKLYKEADEDIGRVGIPY